jgi:hypothetical protein
MKLRIIVIIAAVISLGIASVDHSALGHWLSLRQAVHALEEKQSSVVTAKRVVLAQAAEGTLACPYCGCVFTNDQEEADADDEDSDAARQVADEERMRRAGTSLGDAEGQDTEEPVDPAAALRDQLQSHLMHIVNCNGNGYWITCEHAIEAAAFSRAAVKAEWVRCSDPKTCGDVPEDDKAHPGVRHVGERYSAGLNE